MGIVIHNEYPCNKANYHVGRPCGVKYLVIHYVGAAGGAQANAKYFHSTAGIQASAHYFVGHGSEGAAVYSSVPEGDTAWHIGAKKYVHPECRNSNAVGIELCCHQDGSGHWYFDPETVGQAAKLACEIMAKYKIPVDRVLRHYDVTGKVCPEPYVRDQNAWKAFLQRLG